MPLFPLFVVLIATTLATAWAVDISVVIVLLLWSTSKRRSVVNDLQIVLLSSLSLWLAAEFLQWRYWHPAHPPDALGALGGALHRALLRRLEQHIPSGNLNAFLSAVLVGEKSMLSSDLKEAFRSLGISHLLAVSGFHVGFWVLILQPIFFWARSRWAMIASWAVMSSFLLVYAVAVGSSASVVRAVLTFVFAYFSGRLQYRVRALHWPMVVACGMWLWNPMVVLDLGFQLSFSAVFAILWAMSSSRSADFLNSYNPKVLSRSSWSEKILTPMNITLAAWSATLPIVQFYFQGASPFFLIGNLAVVPVYTMFIWIGFGTLVLGSILPLSLVNGLCRIFVLWDQLVLELSIYLDQFKPEWLQ
ncbi:MAG: hypothetical protein RL754_261 [Bacteroidota bacterium]|jgi:competence protein ComEC